MSTAIPTCPETGEVVVYDVERHGRLVTIFCPGCETLIHVDDE